MSNNQAGKCSKPRPVKKDVYNRNYDAIDWSGKKKKKLKTIDEVCGKPPATFQKSLKENPTPV